jgi:hypothetical protein
MRTTIYVQIDQKLMRQTDVNSWADVPTAILRAELQRRQDGSEAERPACGSGKRGAYNTPIHVGALILILALSTIGMVHVEFPFGQWANKYIQRVPFPSSSAGILASPYHTTSSSSRGTSEPVF